MADHLAVTVRGHPGLLRSLVERIVDRCDLSTVDLTDDELVHVSVLIDPDGWSAEEEPGDRFVVVRSCLDDEQVLDDLARGADAVLGPDAATVELGAAVHAVASGTCWLSPDLTRVVIEALRTREQPDPVELTARERDILVCAAEGKSISQTARALGIAPKTVENLQSRMFRKLDVRNRAQAVAHAHAAGWLDAVNP